MGLTITIPRWTVEAETGYHPITTFWQDFSIADKFGKRAILDTYKRAFDEWKGNYKYLTELVMVLNHKSWQHYKPQGTEQENAKSLLYANLYRKADEYAYTNLKGEELDYYYTTTD